MFNTPKQRERKEKQQQTKRMNINFGNQKLFCGRCSNFFNKILTNYKKLFWSRLRV